MCKKLLKLGSEHADMLRKTELTFEVGSALWECISGILSGDSIWAEFLPNAWPLFQVKRFEDWSIKVNWICWKEWQVITAIFKSIWDDTSLRVWGLLCMSYWENGDCGVWSKWKCPFYLSYMPISFPGDDEKNKYGIV